MKEQLILKLTKLEFAPRGRKWLASIKEDTPGITEGQERKINLKLCEAFIAGVELGSTDIVELINKHFDQLTPTYSEVLELLNNNQVNACIDSANQLIDIEDTADNLLKRGEYLDRPITHIARDYTGLVHIELNA